jgi:ppGpp synthetase/RelA/SpoT-type nucleotidyltranferase
MDELIKQSIFLEKYNIDLDSFKLTTLKWNDLKLIYQDYCKEIPKLESSAIYIFNSLMKTSNVHSVRYRIKDAEHVIEKIIRKRIKDPNQIITIDNYKSELTDLIGLRALHLFKEEWNFIHEVITSTWDLEEKPVANYRDGDSSEFKKEFEKLGCDVKEHKYGYRSVHYIIKTKPAKSTYFAEIQVRTIFEEAWSEIDHTIRYPYDQDNPLFGQFLLILNRLAGSADEMGTFIQYLKKDLQKKENTFKKEMNDKDHLIQELEMKIDKLQLKEVDKKYLTDGLEKLKMPNVKLGSIAFSISNSLSELLNNVDLSNLSNITLPNTQKLPTIYNSDVSNFKGISESPLIQISKLSNQDKGLVLDSSDIIQNQKNIEKSDLLKDKSIETKEKENSASKHVNIKENLEKKLPKKTIPKKTIPKRK